MRLLLQYVSFVLVFVPSAFCQEVIDAGMTDTTFALPEIRISSTRYTPGPNYIAARVSNIDNQKVEATGGQSLDEVLVRAGGLFIRQYGTGLASLSIRGGNSSHSIVAIDGMPLYDPQLGQVDLSLVPGMMLDNVSIMYGQGSSLYGANGLSGVIDIETPSHLNSPVFGSIKGSVGAFGERQADVSLGMKRNKIRFLLALKHGQEKGDFSYKDHSLFPVETVRRQGADRLFSSFFGKVDRTGSSSYSTLSAWGNSFERGIPGPTTLQFRDERQWDRLFRVNAQHVQLVYNGTLAFSGGLQHMSLRYTNPVLQVDDTGRTSSYLLDIYYKYQSSDNNSIKIGIDNALRSARHPSLARKTQEIQTSLYALGEHRFNALLLLPSMRLDHYELPDKKAITAFSPNLGMNINLTWLSSLFVKAQVGKSFKPPTFNDRFWQPGGNLGLRPEVSWGYEAGVHWKPSAQETIFVWSSEVTVYRQHVEDQITWLPTENGYWSPINVSGVLISGMESSFLVSFSNSRTSNGHLELMYHLTDTRNQSDSASPSYNQPLRYTPRHFV